MVAENITLALDSATEDCSVALSVDGSVSTRSVDTPREHSRSLLPMISELLDEHKLLPADVDLFVYSRGPGSFTGLRIGIGIIQGLAYGAGKPTLGISTLACQVQAARRAGIVGPSDRVYSAIDARMDEIYWAYFSVGDDSLELLAGEDVCAPREWRVEQSHSNRCVGVGSGWRYAVDFPEETRSIMAEIEPEIGPSALDLMALVATSTATEGLRKAADAQPVYVRENIAWKKRDEQPQRQT